ncbi:DEAD/DEAH box helicase family protein [Shouchella shacheensis]|uniref:DEAD/DEAH box helicase family protein n=1 Tax=Shouchella shacheensis TaxID=1649580 RepID=UPI0007401CDE|nr:DEAD/DEAH box helicase family protein [Shouchella shacheensis]
MSLYSWSGSPFVYEGLKNACSWNGSLSMHQQKAAATLVKAVEAKSRCLCWAVCGAGKTEILFPALEQAFAKGERVVLATPRTDVVKELAPRFKQAFPQIVQAVLYAGQKQQPLHAQFVIATTHQLLRYFQTFDLAIIDEVDAFPFSYDPSLEHAVTAALKPSSTRILLSATPSKALLGEDVQTIKIPVRYHGYPLPEPTFRWCGNWRRSLARGALPKKLLHWIYENESFPRMVFVPSVHVLESLSTGLKDVGISHKAVHAEATDRHPAIAAFRKQECSLILTTTILERGVTIANLQVAVLGAEDDMFTEAALVQISGRVGRSSSCPTGEIVFFHFGRTQAMKDALRHIRAMNEEGGNRE